MAVKVDPNCYYTMNHEWVRVQDNMAYTGITDYAQQQLSDIVYVEMPEVGDTFAKGEVYGVVESVKAASDCYMALSGEIVEINEELAEEPEVVNSDPYGKGWFVKFAIQDAGELEGLMDPKTYAAFAEEEEQKGAD